jgi:hypothetical protein
VYKSRIPALENIQNMIQEFLLIFSEKPPLQTLLKNPEIQTWYQSCRLIPKRGVNCENRLIKLLPTQKW